MFFLLASVIQSVTEIVFRFFIKLSFQIPDADEHKNPVVQPYYYRKIYCYI
jgi:hypothetical protein